MLLCELFDHQYAWTPREYADAEFGLPHRDARFASENGERYDVTMTPVADDTVKAEFSTIADWGDAYALNGAGDAFKVMSTVRAIITDYVADHAPAKIVFSADEDEPSRVRLYRRMVANLPGYHAEVTRTASGHDFTLSRSNTTI